MSEREIGADGARDELTRILAALRRSLEGLRFGTIELVVHEGRIVQIERREKLRVDDDRTPGASTRPSSRGTRERPDLRSLHGQHREDAHEP